MIPEVRSTYCSGLGDGVGSAGELVRVGFHLRHGERVAQAVAEMRGPKSVVGAEGAIARVHRGRLVDENPPGAEIHGSDAEPEWRVRS